MKSYLLAACITLVSFAAMANAPHSEGNNPKTNVTESKKSVREQLEIQLAGNAWKKADWNLTEQNLATTTFFFNDYGRVEMIGTNDNGTMTYKMKKWRVEETKGAIFLVMSEIKSGGNVEMFKMEATRAGSLMLTPNGSRQQTFLNPITTMTEEESDLLKADLMGSWAHIGYPFQVSGDLAPCGATAELEGAFLNYTFSSNGTFTQQFGSATQTSHLCKGSWDISSDGRFLLLHTEKGTHIAKIKQFTTTRLALEQILVTPEYETLFCTTNKIFTFSKQK